MKGCEALGCSEELKQLARTQVRSFLMRKSQHGIIATYGNIAQYGAVGLWRLKALLHWGETLGGQTTGGGGEIRHSDFAKWKCRFMTYQMRYFLILMLSWETLITDCNSCDRVVKLTHRAVMAARADSVHLWTHVVMSVGFDCNVGIASVIWSCVTILTLLLFMFAVAFKVKDVLCTFLRV